MALPIDRDSLASAWRALAGGEAAGWRTIPVGLLGEVRVLAGRHLPGNEEAVLLGFRKAPPPSAELLPMGRGFAVHRVLLDGWDEGTLWMALSRQSGGSQALFEVMVIDVLAAVHAERERGGRALVHCFIARVRAWQDFMDRGAEGVLNGASEIGLAGELAVLGQIIKAGVRPASAVQAWQGPLGGIHDFAFQAGAIEVKATVASAGFPATIGSLEQLDDALVAPLFLAGVRLSVGGGGSTLPALVDSTRQAFLDDPLAATLLDSRLLHAGYFERFADQYVRQFQLVDTRLLLVDHRFPRLVHADVPHAVLRARYDIDIDMVEADDTSVDAALRMIGVI